MRKRDKSCFLTIAATAATHFPASQSAANRRRICHRMPSYLFFSHFHTLISFIYLMHACNERAIQKIHQHHEHYFIIISGVVVGKEKKKYDCWSATLLSPADQLPFSCTTFLFFLSAASQSTAQCISHPFIHFSTTRQLSSFCKLH